MRSGDVASSLDAAARSFGARDYAAALDALGRVAEALPDDPALVYAQALCLASLARYDEAVRLCDRLIITFRDVRGVSLRAQIAARTADAAAGDDADADRPFADVLPLPAADRLAAAGSVARGEDDWRAEVESDDEAGEEEAPVGASVFGFDDDADGRGGGAPSERAAPGAAAVPDGPDAGRRPPRRGRVALATVGALVAVALTGYGAWQFGIAPGWPRPGGGAAAGPGAADVTRVDSGEGSASASDEVVKPRAIARFPSDRVLGELDVRAGDAAYDAPWLPFAAASGAVAAPAEGLVCRLRVAEHHWLDLQAAAVPELPVTVVHIANSEMTDAVLDELALFPALRGLVVEHAHQLSDDGLARLARVPELESLVLRGTNLLSDEALRVLERLPALRRLDVAETALSDRAMAFLEFLKALDALELPEGTGDIGLAHAAGAAGLEQLGLGRNVTDEGLSVMGAFGHLQRLRVTGSLTAAGIGRLMSLPELDEVEWRGALDVETADALRRLPKLAVLRLTGIELPSGVLERLGGAGKLRRLELAGVTLADPSQFAAELRTFSQEARALREIVFRNMELPRGTLAGLAGHDALTRVDLCGSTVAADDIAALGGVPGLREVNLSGGLRDEAVQLAIGDLSAALPECVVADDDAQTPRRISFPMDASRGVLHLTAVDGAEVAIGRAKGVVPVPRDAEVILETAIEGERDLSFLRLLRPDDLHTLRLPCGAVPRGGLQHLAHLSELRALEIAGMSVDDEQVAYLQALSGLEALSLARTALTDAGVSDVVRAAPGLKRLDLSGCDAVTDAAIGALTRLAALESLDLRGTSVTDAGLSGLRVLFALRRLDVRGTSATAEGVAQLRIALPDCEILCDAETADAVDATPAVEEAPDRP